MSTSPCSSPRNRLTFSDRPGVGTSGVTGGGVGVRLSEGCRVRGTRHCGRHGRLWYECTARCEFGTRHRCVFTGACRHGGPLDVVLAERHNCHQRAEPLLRSRPVNPCAVLRCLRCPLPPTSRRRRRPTPALCLPAGAVVQCARLSPPRSSSPPKPAHPSVGICPVERPSADLVGGADEAAGRCASPNSPTVPSWSPTPTSRLVATVRRSAAARGTHSTGTQRSNLGSGGRHG